MKSSKSLKLIIRYLLFLLTTLGAVLFSIAVSKNGLLWGEVGMSRWMYENTPGFIDFLGDVIDAPITDIGAPLLFIGISVLVYWRWGSYATAGILLAGSLTGLTRLSDVVKRSGPNKNFLFDESKYYFGEGGYPSGHIVYAVMIFGMIAYLSRRHTKSQMSRVVTSAMIFLILLNIWTRISGLHHWPADVMGGILMSVPALMIVIWVYHRVPVLLKQTPKIYDFIFNREQDQMLTDKSRSED